MAAAAAHTPSRSAKRKCRAGSCGIRTLRVHNRNGTVFTPARRPARSARSTPHSLRTCTCTAGSGSANRSGGCSSCAKDAAAPIADVENPSNCAEREADTWPMADGADSERATDGTCDVDETGARSGLDSSAARCRAPLAAAGSVRAVTPLCSRARAASAAPPLALPCDMSGSTRTITTSESSRISTEQSHSTGICGLSTGAPNRPRRPTRYPTTRFTPW
mmetsp:Transcript_9235/g.29106  ORF Transcript_9235/g.29106 Transcript_9235/m.29106 type:complete len:220 (-) Transcript_9235:236-895(-)